MPTTAELKARIEDAIPGARADVVDLTGGGDHFRAVVSAPEFAGLSRIEQHRRVYAVFGPGDRRADPRAVPGNPSRSVGHMSTVEQQIREAIQEAISENEVILFMKGTPEAPRCGFSARTVATLEALGTQFAAVDILPDPRIRQELSALSNWPTIPQLFVRGELVGGCRHRRRRCTSRASSPRCSASRRRPTRPRRRRSASEAGAPPLTIENRLDS